MYGLPEGRLSYDTFVALSLNLPRQKAKREDELRQALVLAGTPEKAMPLAWYRHLTDSEREAQQWRADDVMAILSRQAAAAR